MTQKMKKVKSVTMTSKQYHRLKTIKKVKNSEQCRNAGIQTIETNSIVYKVPKKGCHLELSNMIK